ncbi:DinB family protein [Mucilaginibacter sp. CSA2-8R]|uniref:DinB family protein n=1 Tax=Mucilaginibacter sp. CSA2-8R TaxID=3141542 RepID=UPI00315C762C
MNIIALLLKELNDEAQTTRKMLERIPNDQFDWQPHPKSMTIRRLASHIADLPNWIAMAINTSELDFAGNDWKEEVVDNTEALLAYNERSLTNGRTQLERVTEDQLLPQWTLRNGEHILGVWTKYEVIRMSFSQIVHHRGQLGVYLRLLDIPIPGSYGPSADEMENQF